MTKNKQTYGQYLASFITAPDPVAPPAGAERHCKWCGLPESESHEGHIFSPYCTEYDDPPSPAIGDVQKLCQQGDQFDPPTNPTENLICRLTRALRTLAANDKLLRAANKIFAERDEVLCAEKAELSRLHDQALDEISAVNAEKAKVEEERDHYAKELGECSGGYETLEKEVAYLRAKLERAREGLAAIAGGRWNSGKYKIRDKTLTAIEFASATLEELND